MDNLLVSVILPAYNCEQYISECIESLLAQTYLNLEILIADDGSLDGTKKMIDQYQEIRIKCHHNPTNQGVTKTRNKLITKAKGKLIALQDADDWSSPFRIERQVSKFLNDNNLVACGTGYNKVTSNNKILYTQNYPSEHAIISNKIPEEFLFQCPSVMFKSDYIKNNPYSDFFGNSGNEDLYLMGKLILHNKFVNIPEPLYNYRLNHNSLTKLGQLSNIRRLYIHKITTKLLVDLRETGSNWIERGELTPLEEYENSLKEKYENDPALLFEYNIGQMLYWKQYGSAIQLALKNLFSNGINSKNLHLILYVIKITILKK